ncbi:MAG: hypothetical protein ABIJ12_09750 [bacterium]
MSKWEEDLEWSEAAKPIQDLVYRYVFGDTLQDIARFSKDDRHVLDREYHIDVELTLKNGIKLLGQEKALRKQFAEFNTFTIEFYQNRYTKEKGEFFNLGAQFYLHGYLDGDTPDEIKASRKFIKCYFIKIFDFLEYLKKKPISVLEKNSRRSSGNASFYYIQYDSIPKEFIYWRTP